MNNIFALYGAAGCGRSLMPSAIEQLKLSGNYHENKIIFIDDAYKEITVVNGYLTMNYAMFAALDTPNKSVLIAISNSLIRQKLAEKLLKDNISMWTVIDDTAIVMDEVNISSGAALSPYVTIGSNVSIGKCFHANLYSYVEHDCIIGDFVTFAPRVNCNGNIHIHDHAYIGTGAIIKNGKPDQPIIIGRGAIVGMGAVVTKNVPAGAVVVGNPARPLIK